MRIFYGSILLVAILGAAACQGADDTAGMSFENAEAESTRDGNHIVTTLSDPATGSVILTATWDVETGVGEVRGDRFTAQIKQEQYVDMTLDDANDRSYEVWGTIEQSIAETEEAAYADITCRVVRTGACGQCTYISCSGCVPIPGGYYCGVSAGPMTCNPNTYCA